MEKEKSKIIPVNFDIMTKVPKWFVKAISWNTMYYEECLTDFELIRDNERFADGSAFFCRKCHMPCYCRLDAAEDFKTFIVTTIICHLGCGKVWRLKDIEPIWVRVMEDWDNEAYEASKKGEEWTLNRKKDK